MIMLGLFNPAAMRVPQQQQQLEQQLEQRRQ
jgi:hypothetical protein